MSTLIAPLFRKALVLAGITALAISTSLSQGSQQAVVSPVDTFMAIVPTRPVNEIKQDIDVIDAYRARAKARVDELKEQTRNTDAQISMKENEISLLESRQDAADKQKNDAEVASLKTQIEGVNRIRDLLKQCNDLYSAEISAAEAALDYASAAQDLYDKEIALAKKREEAVSQAGAGGSKAAVGGSNGAILDFENKVLEAQNEKLKKQEKLLSRDQDVVEKQQQLAETQGRLLTK